VQWLTPGILDTQEAEMKSLEIQSQSGEKVKETSSQPVKLSVVACACYPSGSEGVNRRIVVQVGPDKNEKPYLKKH
jgi:hypothetical protein